MAKRNAWRLSIICLSLLAMAMRTSGQESSPTKLTPDDVVKLWSPNLKSATDFGQLGGAPKEGNVASYTFSVTGPTFEELWNHYAQLCGTKYRYEEKHLRVTADTGPQGTFVISDGGDGKGGRGLSVFLLQTDSYTVTVTFHANPNGQPIRGSLSAVVQ